MNMTLKQWSKRLGRMGLTTIMSAFLAVCAAQASPASNCIDVFRASKNRSLTQSKLGDLSRDEIATIQHVVDTSNLPLVVVGSAAEARRRNRDKPVEIGKGENQRSDIDYVLEIQNPVDQRLAWYSIHYGRLKPIYQQLPSIDWHLVLVNNEAARTKVRILFSPHRPPRRVEAGDPIEEISRFSYLVESKEEAIETIRFLAKTAEMHLGDRDIVASFNPDRAREEESKAEQLLIAIEKLKQAWGIQ